MYVCGAVLLSTMWSARSYLWLFALILLAGQCAGSQLEPSPGEVCRSTALDVSIGVMSKHRKGAASPPCAHTFQAARGHNSTLLCPASLHQRLDSFLSLTVHFARGMGSQLSVHSLGAASHGSSVFFHREAHGMSSRRLLLSWTYSDGLGGECEWSHTLAINFDGFPATDRLEQAPPHQQDFANWRTDSGALVSSYALPLPKATWRNTTQSLGLLLRSPLSVDSSLVPSLSDATCKVRVEGAGRALLNFVDPAGQVKGGQIIESWQTPRSVDCAAGAVQTTAVGVQAASLRGIVNASVERTGFLADTPVYTPLDWARWTGWDPAPSKLIRPDHVAALKETPFRRGYTANVQRTFQQFRWFWFSQANSVSYLVDKYIVDRVIDGGAVSKGLSAHLGQIVAKEYEKWLSEQRSAGRDTDKIRVPWETFDAFSLVSSALDQLPGAAWRLQELNHVMRTCDGPAGKPLRWDSFGAAPLRSDKYNGGWDQDDLGRNGLPICDVADRWHEKVYDLLLPMVHFSSLTSSALLREIRARIGPSLTACFASLKVAKPFLKAWATADLFFIDSRLEIQILYLSVLNLHAAFLFRSKEIMQQRGDWLPSDANNVQDPDKGQYTDEWLRDYLDSTSALLRRRTKDFGINELLGPYNDLQFKNGAHLWMYAATQEVADTAQALYSTIWSNIALHYSPSIKDVSIPVARQKSNEITGTFLGWTSFERQLFVSTFGPDLCANIAGCVPGFVAPLWDSKSAPSIDTSRVAMYSMLISGTGTPPLFALQKSPIFFDSSSTVAHTVLQRCTPFSNGDRTNFVAANYTIGSSVWLLEWQSAGMPFAARLGGMPSQPAAESYEDVRTDPVQPPRQKVEQLPMIRIGSEQEDNPFNRSALGSIPSVYLLRSYQVSAQYQSFQLLTQIAFPGQSPSTWNEWRPSKENKPLQSDLLLPLFVDGGVWVSNQNQQAFQLPTAAGTCVVIPLYPNPVFTVRHRSASIGVRLLLAETNNIQNAPSIRTCTTEERELSKEGSGTQPFSVMWRVDVDASKADGNLLGVGRVVVAHVRRGSAVRRAFYSAWLIGGGTTRSEAERASFQSVLMQAVPTYSTQNYSSWHDWGDLSADWDNARFSSTPPGCTFDMSVNIAAQHTLKVSRTDYYGGTEAPLLGRSSPSSDLLQPLLSWRQLYDIPIEITYAYEPLITGFSRWVDGVSVTSPADGTPQVTTWNQASLFQPHLAQQQAPRGRISHAKAHHRQHSDKLFADV